MYNIGQFNGKWQEVSRTDNSGNPADFTDTTYLHFIDTGRVITRNGITSNMKGDAVIEDPNTLLTAGDVYTILSLTDSMVVLDNQEGACTYLEKNKQFSF